MLSVACRSILQEVITYLPDGDGKVGRFGDLRCGRLSVIDAEIHLSVDEYVRQ